MVYNLFCVFVMYLFPLGVIIYCYSRILIKLCNRPTDFSDTSSGPAQDEESTGGRGNLEPGGVCRVGVGVPGPGPMTPKTTAPTSAPRFHLRRNDVSNIERARSRTLRMTVNIVFVFICCWTPYVVMTLWYTFHRESAKMVDSRVQDMLFITAVLNSCMNPLVYGNYVINVRQQCTRLAAKICSEGKFLKQCSCCCCICVCGKPEAVPETIIMDVVPATTRPPRRKFQSLQQSSQQPEENQKSQSSLSRILTTKFPGDIQEYHENAGCSNRPGSPERGNYRRPRRCHCSLTPEHSSAPAEMPSERERRRSALWEEPSSVG